MKTHKGSLPMFLVFLCLTKYAYEIKGNDRTEVFFY